MLNIRNESKRPPTITFQKVLSSREKPSKDGGRGPHLQGNKWDMPPVFCKTARAWVTLLYVATARSSLQTFGLQMVTYGWPCLPHLWLPYPGVWKACWCLFACQSWPEVRFRCHFPDAVCVVFFETGSLSLAWGSLNRLGWLHVSPREMPVSIVTVFELKAGRQL